MEVWCQECAKFITFKSYLSKCPWFSPLARFNGIPIFICLWFLIRYTFFSTRTFSSCHSINGGLLYMWVGILIQLHQFMSTPNMYILVVIGIMLHLSSYINLAWFTRLLASLSQHRWRFDVHEHTTAIAKYSSSKSSSLNIYAAHPQADIEPLPLLVHYFRSSAVTASMEVCYIKCHFVSNDIYMY